MTHPLSRILIISGIALCFFGIKGIIDFQQFKASMIRVTATVDERTPGGLFRNRTPQSPTISLRYETGGNKIHVVTNAINKHFSKLKKGDTVELVLVEGNPKKFMPAASMDQGGIVGPFLLIAGAVVSMLGSFLFRR